MLSEILYLLLGFFALTSRAIEVTTNSSCASDCGGGLTFYFDLTCTDDGYDHDSEGQKMKNCLLCESTSTTYNNPVNNDIYWFLFNVKYTSQYCLYQNTSRTTALPTCESTCQPLKPVLESSWFTTPQRPQYDYCTQNGGAFGQYVEDCASCLQSVPGSVVLGNFLNTMQSACKTKPNATEGSTISLQRQLFNATVVPSGSSSAASTTTLPASSSTSPAPTAASTSASASRKSSGLSSGAAAGIGVGVGLVALIAVGALVWFVLRRRTRARSSPNSPSNTNLMVNETNGDTVESDKKHDFDRKPSQLDGTPLAEADDHHSPSWRAELPANN